MWRDPAAENCALGALRGALPFRRARGRRFSTVVLCWIALSAGGCRLGYEILSDDDSAAVGDGSAGALGSGSVAAVGGVGAGGAGASGNESGAGGTSTGGTSSIFGDYHVTTGVDEADAGATVVSPGGTGLSFREALTLANATSGQQVITFEPALITVLGSILPQVSESVEVYGDGTRFDASAVSGIQECWIISAPSLVDGIEFYGCLARPILVSAGSGTQIRNSYFHDNAQALETSSSSSGTIVGPGNTFVGGSSHAIALNGLGDELRNCQIYDPGQNGVFVGGTADNPFLVGNLIVRAAKGISLGSGVAGASIWHNTIVSSAESAIVVGQASENDLRNNVLTHSTNYGVVGGDDKFVRLDHNLYFQNSLGNCNPCTLGASSVLSDPQYVNFADDDFSLQLTSPAIDAGGDTGTDVNGGTAGLFDGAAPDIGYYEAN